MLQRLRMAGVEVRRARSSRSQRGETYAARHMGYPGRTSVSGICDRLDGAATLSGTAHRNLGPTKRPYDVAGWTLPMLMGVAYDRVDKPFDSGTGGQPNRVTYRSQSVCRPQMASYCVSTSHGSRIARRGWTQWVFDRLQIPYTVLRNADIAQGDLGSRFDTVLFASQSTASILHGYRAGENTTRGGTEGESAAPQRPEFTGGIGIAGESPPWTRLCGRAAGWSLSIMPLISRPVFGLARSTFGVGARGSIAQRLLLSGLYSSAKRRTGPSCWRFRVADRRGTSALLPSLDNGDREVRVLARYATRTFWQAAGCPVSA